MPKESIKESLIKIQVNAMVDYLVNQCSYTYSEAWLAVMGSKTYHRMLKSSLYLSQGTLYVLSDLKRELGLEVYVPA